MISLDLPDWSASTWIALSLAVLLVVLVLAVPALRQWVGEMLLAVGALLAAGGAGEMQRREAKRQSDQGRDLPDPELETDADDLQQETESEIMDEQEPSASDVADDLNELTGNE